MMMSSSLLPRVFESVGPGKKFTVLDLGSTTPQSVRFFNQFSCRVYFADLLDEDSDHAGDDVFGFEFPSHVRFDVCLFWDVLNYLDEDALNRVAKVVTGRLNQGCHGHAFLAFTQAVPFSGLSFGIEAVDRLVAEPDPHPVPHAHTWKDLETMMWPFTSAASTLLQGNRQELLLINR